MGAETSLFKKLSIDTEVQYKCKDYSLLNARHDSNRFSVFLFSDHNFTFDISHWKTIRHPFIVKYYDCGLFRGHKCVVTEWVTPVTPLVQHMNKQVVTAGVHNVANALSFIHKTCLLSVNNLQLDSIFVSRSERTDCWKVGSLLCLSSAQTDDRHFCDRLWKYHQSLSTTDTLPAEDIQSTPKMQCIVTADQIHRRDAYALSLLLHRLLPDHPFTPAIECLASNSPDKRPTMAYILSEDLFANSEYVKIKSFLTSFVSFNENQKNEFFADLVDRLRQLSDELVVSLVSLIVNSRLIMSNSAVHNQLLPFVLIPANDSDEEVDYILTSGETVTLKPLLNKKVFKTRIIPLICKLFCVRDLRIRLLLLQYLPNYATFISKGCLRQLVLPQILYGIKDSNDELVSLTFKAISHLVSIFGANTVLGPRLKLFTNGIPKHNHTNNDGSEVESLVGSDTPEPSLVDKSDDKSIAQNECINGWTERQSLNENNRSKSISSDTLAANVDNKSVDSNGETGEHLNAVKMKSNLGKKSHLVIRSDLDIKELDFKLEDNEIDNLFSDMEPVFKFSSNNLIPESLMGLKNSGNTSNLFAANDELNDETGWTDNAWDNDWDKDDK